MGTRSVVGFRINNQDKLSYNQYDGYFEGVGADVVLSIRKQITKESLEEIKRKAQDLILVDKDSTPTDEQQRTFMEAGLYDGSVSNQSPNDWYCLLRHAQGKPFMLLDAGIMLKANDFVFDSLSCEYAYIINLDTMKFEVYVGGINSKHNKERYGKERENPDVDGYYPVALIGEFDLMDIPDSWISLCER